MIQPNTIHYGDNLEIIRDMDDESIHLIYADPPFFTQKNFDDFTDKFDNIDAYIQWMRVRLEECYRLLKKTGSMYIHLDHHAVFNVKVMLDDIFKTGGFKTMITWKRCTAKGNSKTFANNSDYILYYQKSKKFVFNTQYKEYSDITLKEFKYDDHDGRGLYESTDLSAPGGNGYTYALGYGEKIPSRGYGWKKETMLKKIEDNRVVIKSGKVPRQKRYLAESGGVPFDNIWTDIGNVMSPIYPTQKPPALLERIIKSSSNPGDTVLDPFCGSGTTLVAAKSLGRKYIGIDQNTEAIEITRQRLSNVQTQLI